MSKKGMLVVLSAPSGCGKDTVFKMLAQSRDDVCESVSATTRLPRDGEVDGVNYYFKSNEQFEEMIKNNQLLEYTTYNNCYYGTPVDGVENAIAEGKVCFLIIEVEGFQNIMKKRPDCVSIFLLPPSLEILKHRLVNRSTNDEADIQRRLEFAEKELELAHMYKYNVVNDVLDDAVSEISEIINKELSARN